MIIGRNFLLRSLLPMAVLLALGVPVFAVEKPAGNAHTRAVLELSARIDQRIDARLQTAGVEPSAAADDAEFLRRVWLHLAGTIPPVPEVRRFLAENNADKRDRVIQQLLSRPAYVRNFTTFWRRAWLPEADTDFLAQARVPAVEAWLRQRLQDETRYQELVRQFLAAPITNSPAARGADNMNGPVAFLLAREAKPENLAASTSRAFLGVRLDCAQCHDHPFDRWKRDQFWSFAAFFAGLEQADGNQPLLSGLREVTDRRELMIPDTERLVSAVFLDGSAPKWRARSGREVLADWITSPGNPYFARTAVNRLWGHLFGIGLVDPVDDFSAANAPSHPELLEELAAAFVQQQYDVKFLLQSILKSRAYQRTSRMTRPDVPLTLYAHLPLQGLTSGQLLLILSGIVGTGLPAEPAQPPVVMPEDITTVFSRPGEGPTQRQTTILQALTLMNGRTTAGALDFQNSTLLAAVADFPGLTVDEQVDILYLGTLSRFPRDAERARFRRHLEQATDPRTALADLLWALLNSTEFSCNH